MFEITGKKSGYGITHSINSLLWVSISMEPKSIAFYTAVAVSILAVLSATTFPIIAQAQGTDAQETQEQPAQGTDTEGTDAQETQEQPAQEDNEVMTEQSDSQEDNEDVVEQTDSEEEERNSANSNDNGAAGAASERLGLQPNSGIASCGQVITEDVTLTSDLNCSNGDGLIVGASGITINMNGYSISSGNGPGSQDPTTNSGNEPGSQDPTTNSGNEPGSEARTADYDGSSGILVANADNVAISGLGEISGFSRGVTFLGSSGGALTDVQLANNDIGAVVANSEGTEISRNTLTNNGIAVVSDSSNGGVTAFNQIVANLEEGILILGSSDNVVAANNMYGNGANGIYLDPMSEGNHIDYNTVFGHETADLNNADGMPTNVNQNSFGDNNNCGTSLPGGLCR
jgi:parallel beta-helix repeat protein